MNSGGDTSFESVSPMSSVPQLSGVPQTRFFRAWERHQYPLFIANAMANVGEYDLALDWLERSVNWGFTNYRFLGEHNRFLAPVKDKERFRALLATAEERCRSFDT